MFFRRRNFNAGTLLEFQIVAIFLISESFESPPQPRKGEILSAGNVPSEFPKYSNKAEFQGAPILDLKNFDHNTSFRDVINAINQIIRQKTNQPTRLENAPVDTQLNRTRATINYIQNITICQNPTENTRWFLLAAVAILLVGFLAFSSRGKLYRNQYSSAEHLISGTEYKEPNNVIDRK